MTQCYGSHDHIGSNPNRKSFIEEWADKKNIKIGCRYYSNVASVANY